MGILEENEIHVVIPSLVSLEIFLLLLISFICHSQEKIVEDAKVERVAVPPVDKQDTIQEDDEKTTESSTGGDAEPAKEDAPAEEEEQQQQTSSKAIMEDEYEESQGAEDATKETESPWNRCGCDPAVLKILQAAVGF
jgi:hypothetical protein